MGARKKTTAAMVICLVALVLVFGVTSLLKGGLVSERENMQAQIDNVKASVELAQDDLEKESTENVARSYGVSLSRMTADEVGFEEFCQKVFTWDSYEEYNAARKAAMDEYGVSENSWFLSDYMAEIKEVDNGYGRMVNPIDERGYNLYVADVDVRLMSAEDDVYKYFAEVETASDYKDQTGNSYVVVMFETSEEGKIANIDAIPVN